MRPRILSLIANLALLIPPILSAQPAPVGRWDFDAADNLLQATAGNDLVLHGSHQRVPGVTANDGAVTIGTGSYYACTHGIEPNGGGSRVNQWSLLIDFRVSSLGAWYCLYQTDPTNANDTDCAVHLNTGTIGIGQTGYSSTAITPGTWYRMVVATDAAVGQYDIYLNGARILDGNPPESDGRFSLAPTVLFFADENGEDAPITVSTVAIYGRPLTSSEIANLGDAQPKDPNNHAPLVVPQPGGSMAVAGTSAAYSFEATDPDNDTVSFRIDWGDGNITGWSSLRSVLVPFPLSHTYACPGDYDISGQVRDEHGLLSEETPIQTVSVSGGCTPEFLAEPFLQNLKPNGITLMWELAPEVPCTVEYGLTGNYGSSIEAASEDSGFSTTIYKAVLSGLQPFTTYHYRVIASNSITEDRVFKTGTDDRIDFAFSVWGDSQGTNYGAYPADPYEPTNAMMRHMRDDPGIHLGTNAGDLAEHGASYTMSHEYYVDRVAKYLGQSKAWFSAWGNHDAGRSAPLRKFADFPSKDRTGLIDGLSPTPGWGSYSFDYAGCHFIMVDDNTRTYDVLNWVEEDLQSEANQSARFTFVYVHRPPYCEAWLEGESIYQSNLVPLMEEYGVDACFSGHTHGYGRGFLNGVYYCVTGGGSWLDTGELLVRDWPHMTVGGYHPLAIDTSPLGLGGYSGMVNEYVKVNVAGDTWKATALCFRPSGEYYGVIDEFGDAGPVSAVDNWLRQQ